MKVVRLYGSQWGIRRLAWVGFADRIEFYFVPIGHGRYMRYGVQPSEGWSDTYTLG